MSNETMTDARALREAIDRYWELAYTEGKDGRTHDTENGDAQKTSMEIDRLIARLRVDADRWQHARKILTIDDIEGAQGAFDSFGRMFSEHECERADAAIDAARTKEQES